jgi:acyl-CoA synthetase (AMP-forming)/AMP-acid ligase II/thioesterase domain-containing protein/acyl carrier protein
MQRNHISRAIFDYAAKDAGKLALLNPDGSGVTYHDFEMAYHQLSSFFNQISLNHTDRIAVLSEDGISLGLLSLPVIEHAVFVPLDFDLNVDQLAYYYHLLKVDYILTDRPESHGCIAAKREGLGVIAFKRAIMEGQCRFEFNIIQLPSFKPSIPHNDPNGIAMVLTTSGTTSTPKIVPATYESLHHSIETIVNHYDYNENTMNLILTKMSRINSVSLMLRSLFAGGSAVICNGFKHNELIDILNRLPVTSFVLSPAVLVSLADYAEKNGLVIPHHSLSYIRATGAPLTRQLKDRLEELFHVPVIQSYGMTETKNIASTYRAPKGYKEGSAGVSTGSSVRILDGELLVKGPSVFSGYEDDPESNRNTFTDGWFRTGDVGYVDEDGYIFITGRIKEMINRGGEKVSPYELEKAILSIPGFRDAVAFPCPNPYGSEDVGVAVVLQQDYDTDLVSLRKLLYPRTDAYKLPTLLYVIDEIPAGPGGKIQRKNLYESLAANFPDKGESLLSSYDNKLAPDMSLTETQQKLLEIWSKVLNVKQINPNHTFFDQGGDSLSAAALFSEIEDAFGVQIPIVPFFKDGSIANLSFLVENSLKSIRLPRFIVPIKSSGSKAPLFCIHTGDGEAVTYHNLGRFMAADRPVYAIRFNRNHPGFRHPVTFEQLAVAYADEMMDLFPDKSYHLCGTCLGGVLALALGKELIDRGCAVPTLAMFDSAYRNGHGGNKFKRLIINSIQELSSHSAKNAVPLLFKKISTSLNLVRLKIGKAIYRKACQISNDSWINLVGKPSILAYAYSLYRPPYYDGRVHYFASKKDRVKSTSSHDRWRPQIPRLVVVDMNCRHTEINNEENSSFLAYKLSEIMED